jgi:hypothetical protein
MRVNDDEITNFGRERLREVVRDAFALAQTSAHLTKSENASAKRVGQPRARLISFIGPVAYPPLRYLFRRLLHSMSLSVV